MDSEPREGVVAIIQVRHNSGWTRVTDVKPRCASRCILIVELIEFAGRPDVPVRERGVRSD